MSSSLADYKAKQATARKEYENAQKLFDDQMVIIDLETVTQCKLLAEVNSSVLEQQKTIGLEGQILINCSIAIKELSASIDEISFIYSPLLAVLKGNLYPFL